MLLKDFKNKKILILGFGKEGKDSYLALRRLFPDKTIGIADQKRIKNKELRIKNDGKFKLHLGDDYLNSLKHYDLIIKTPGTPLSKIRPFLRKGAKITSQTKIFFDNFKGTVIGITGTKGKGTTASLIHLTLKKAGIKTCLLGNIGKPVFQWLIRAQGNETVVYELSSHQLQGLKKSPRIAVFLNLFSDHLDYYKNIKEYQKAKGAITKYQKAGDWLVYNADDKLVRAVAKKTKAKKISFSHKDREWLNQVVAQKNIPLKGEFNLLNVMAAIRVGEILGIPKKHIKRTIKSFKGLPHRLEFVGKFKGVEFYDDSMATIPEVTIAALKAFDGKAKTLIVGGSEKGSDYKDLAKEILKNKVRTLITLSPGTGEKLWQECFKFGRPSKFETKARVKKIEVKSMKEAVKTAYETTNRGEVCLMSPAAASFNLFCDYRERGNLFKRWVKHYAQ